MVLYFQIRLMEVEEEVFAVFHKVDFNQEDVIVLFLKLQSLVVPLGEKRDGVRLEHWIATITESCFERKVQREREIFYPFLRIWFLDGKKCLLFE